jgi:hypothetical protein
MYTEIKGTEQQLHEYRMAILQRLKAEYEAIPETSETFVSRVKRLGIRTQVACARDKEEIDKLLLEKFLY